MPGSDDEKDRQKTTPWGADDRTTPHGSTPPQVSSISPAGSLDSEKPRADSHGNEVIAGQVFGHYRILEKIGEGGMGVVYRARDERLERDVALKVLPDKALADETARALLLREARTASSLNHPHICTIYDVGEVNGQMYVTMELLKGRPLSALIKKGGLPAETVVRYGTQIAEALSHAHANGIIHRDLKSANVVVTNEERAKVLDFGIAKRFRAQELAEATQSTDSLGMSGPIVGTVPYMAPEILRGMPADVRSDIWALGVVLYEMAAGATPFRGQTGSELTSSILRDEPAPLPAGVPSGLRGVIQLCLVKEPERRCQSANEVRAMLSTTQHQATRIPTSFTRSRRGILAVSAAAIVILLATLFGLNVLGVREKLTGPSEPSRSAPLRISSIAVLPLDNLSHDPAQDYFADGMTEELITALFRLRRLNVVSRTSVMRFKGTRETLPSIARQLGADAVVEGTVMRNGNRIRISARLVYAPADRQLWAETYDCDLKDILALQSRIARDIASEVKVSLSPEEQARLASSLQVNPTAYDDYLRGRYHGIEDVAAARKNVEDLRKSGIERTDVVSEINRAEELKFNELLAISQRTSDTDVLEQVQREFNQIGAGNGPLAAKARQMADVEIPPTLERIKRRRTPAGPTGSQIQEQLMSDARSLIASKKFDSAGEKLKQAKSISGGTHGADIDKMIATIVRMKSGDASLIALLAKEDVIWKKGLKAYGESKASEARKAFDEIVKMQGGQRRADAHDYLTKKISDLEKADGLLAPARLLAQKKDKASLDQARNIVQQVIAMGGPKADEARNLEGAITRGMNALSGEAAAAATAAKVNELKSGAAQDIGRDDFDAARAKADEIRSLGGDPAQMTSAITSAEQRKANSLQTQFNSARNDACALKQLQAELHKYMAGSGRIGETARDVSGKIPPELTRLEAASRLAPSAAAAAQCASVQVLPPGLSRMYWTGPLAAGQLVHNRYLDSPLKLLGGDVPQEIAKRAEVGASVQLRVDVDAQGRVAGGTLNNGDAGIGQELLNLAKTSWQFSPPLVNGKPVTTQVTVKVQFAR